MFVFTFFSGVKIKSSGPSRKTPEGRRILVENADQTFTRSCEAG